MLRFIRESPMFGGLFSFINIAYEKRKDIDAGQEMRILWEEGDSSSNWGIKTKWVGIIVCDSISVLGKGKPLGYTDYYSQKTRFMPALSLSNGTCSSACR
jgi:hypothetical protein